MTFQVPLEVDVTKSDERVRVHIGARWQQALADLAVRRPRDAKQALLDIAAGVDIQVGGHWVFSSSHPLRVLSFIVSLAEAISHAERQEGEAFHAHDGVPSFPALRVARKGTRIVLTSPNAAFSVPRQELNDALRATIDELMDDVEGLPAGALLVFAIKKLSRAEALLSAAVRPRRATREGSLDDELRSEYSDLFSEGTPFLTGPLREGALDARGGHVSRRVAPHAVERVRMLRLSEAWDATHPLRSDWTSVFTAQGELAMIGVDGIELVDLSDGEWQRLTYAAEGTSALRVVGDYVVFDAEGALHALNIDGAWEAPVRLAAPSDAASVRALVATSDARWMLLRDDGALYASTGERLLEGVEEISCAPQFGEVAALRSGRRAVDRVGADITRWFVTEAPIIAFCTGDFGAFILTEDDARRLVITWIDEHGSTCWQRATDLKLDGQSPNLRAHVAEQGPSVCVTLSFGSTWFAARIHRRSELSEFVAWGQEETPARVVFAQDYPVVVTGRSVRVFPQTGRNPDPLWDARQLADPLNAGAAMPFDIRANVIAYGSSRVSVRDLETGHEYCGHNGGGTPVMKLHLSPDLSLTVIGRSGEHRLEIHHAEPIAMLALVGE